MVVSYIYRSLSLSLSLSLFLSSYSHRNKNRSNKSSSYSWSSDVGGNRFVVVVVKLLPTKEGRRLTPTPAPELFILLWLSIVLSVLLLISPPSTAVPPPEKVLS